MEIGAAEYVAAAKEHLAAATQCHVLGLYLTCHYLCGLAVECILRAYRWLINDEWDGRHVLPRLYREARFDNVVPEGLRADITDAFALVSERWSNNHRYASPSKLVKHLNDLGATRGVKGDKLKKNSDDMYTAAELIVQTGVNRWKN